MLYFCDDPGIDVHVTLNYTVFQSVFLRTCSVLPQCASNELKFPAASCCAPDLNAKVCLALRSRFDDNVLCIHDGQ